MKEIAIPMDQAGRIVLPKSVRQELALKPGDRLKVSVQGSSVTLTPKRETTGFVRKGRALIFATADVDTLRQETVNRILEETRDGRHEHALAGFRAAKH